MRSSDWSSDVGSSDLHGLAWLGGDFRDGPSEEITSGETIILESVAPISLEYDCELGETPSPVRFGLAASAVACVATARPGSYISATGMCGCGIASRSAGWPLDIVTRVPVHTEKSSVWEEEV